MSTDTSIIKRIPFTVPSQLLVIPKSDYINILPIELLRCIFFDFLDFSNKNLQLVCKRWKKIVQVELKTQVLKLECVIGIQLCHDIYLDDILRAGNHTALKIDSMQKIQALKTFYASKLTYLSAASLPFLKRQTSHKECRRSLAFPQSLDRHVDILKTKQTIIKIHELMRVYNELFFYSQIPQIKVELVDQDDMSVDGYFSQKINALLNHIETTSSSLIKAQNEYSAKDSGIVGFLPNKIELFDSLRTLNLSHCALISLPTGVENLPITDLNISNNSLRTVPNFLNKIKDLSALDISDNALLYFPHFNNKNLLFLKANNIGLRTLPNLENLKQMKHLSLSNNHFNEFPTALFQLPNLESLDLRATCIKSIPKDISCLAKLTHLFLCDNPLENFPLEILRLSTLKGLTLSNTRLHKLPSQISKLNLLESLDIGKNHLENLPESLSKLILLTELFVNDNKIKHFSDKLENLTLLRHFTAKKNRLSVFPSCILKLADLVYLELNANPIKVIPKEIGSLKNMRILKLSFCCLKALPEELSSLNQLQKLDVSLNIRLSGTEVEGLKEKMPNLRIIN